MLKLKMENILWEFNVENASYSFGQIVPREQHFLKPILMAIEKKILKPLQYMEAVITY